VAIVVFGEEPYAEGVGDVENVNYQQGAKTDLILLERLKSQGIPVVSVFISGRPLYVNAELNASDAFVAAWLPGSEGAGVSDVLLADANGKFRHDFKGRLSYSWPASPLQTEVNRHDKSYAPLLPYGFGLSYDEAHNKSQNHLPSSLAVETIATKNERDLVFFKNSKMLFYGIVATAKEQTISFTSNVAEVDGLKIRTIDKDVQEDARQLIFSGIATSTIKIVSPKTLDLSDERSQGQSLFLNLRLESPVSDSVFLSMQCQNDCKNEIDISSRLKKLELNQWQEINNFIRWKIDFVFF